MLNIKREFLTFFKEKDHVIIPSASIIPENDPTCLFNTAGMMPLVPYLKGAPHPQGKRLADVQKCFRTNDLEEVGDGYHHTFFEMLGNWSLGDYFKDDAIAWSFEFLTKRLNIPVEKLAVTVFRGNDMVEPDEYSAGLWEKQGIPRERIAFLPESDNWWPNIEMLGPCGPDTEIFYYRGENTPKVFDPEDKNWCEIWNNVFMQYNHLDETTFEPLKFQNVDTGMGVERMTATLEGVDDNYMTSIFSDIIAKIEELSGQSYSEEENKRPMRIIADHLRAVVMISGDYAKIAPSNTDQGYVLRRLIRRAIRYARGLNIDINSDWDRDLASMFIDKYVESYPELETNRKFIIGILSSEKKKFSKTLDNGLKEFGRLARNMQEGDTIDGTNAFHLYDTFGFPIELTEELAAEKGFKVDSEGFAKKFEEHQAKSRAGAEQKFKGGLASTGDEEVKYHTATHLLNAALRIVVGPDVHQRGSNITAERMRFDFNCDHKMTDEEKKQTEELVNSWIKQGIPVVREEMSKDEAVKTGAEAMFIEKYGDVVTVYTIGDVSKELCGGPHVANTADLGSFRIKKEEASSAGVRRIKAVLE